MLWSRPRLEDLRAGVRCRSAWGGRWVDGRSRSPAAPSACCSSRRIVAGFAGPPDPLSNFAPVFVLIVFWVGWPSPASSSATSSAPSIPGAPRGGRSSPAASRPYPERFGIWPAAVALLLFTWLELASGWGEHPARLAAAALAYSLVTWAGMAVLRRGDVDPPRRGVQRLLQPALPHLDVREPRRRGRTAAAAVRPPAARAPAGDGRLRRRDDRHRHLRRAQPGRAVEEPLRRIRRASSPTRSGCCSASRSWAASIGSG